MKRKWLQGIVLALTIGLLSGCGAAREVQESEVISTSSETEVSAETSAEATKAPETSKQPQEGGLDEYCETVEFPAGTKMLTLSGKIDDWYSSEDYSAYESEKYILLVDKNVKLPGNYINMLDDIIDTIEEVSGLSFATERKDFGSNMKATRSGEYPWADLKSGNKFIIQLNDKKRNGNEVPSPTLGIGYMTIYDRGLWTFEGEPVCESDYGRMVSEVLLGLFHKYQPDLVYSDSADEAIYCLVIDKLQQKYDDMKRLENWLSIEVFPTDLIAGNVEEAWISTHYNWEEWRERTGFEELFIIYMLDTQDNSFLPYILSETSEDTEEDRTALAAKIKELYGDEVFVNFYNWVHGKMPEKPQELVITGDKKGTFTTEKACYIRGERCFLYVEAGLTIPNDYVEKADAIIAELEKQMWNVDKPISYKESLASDYGTFYGISNKGKMPIVLKRDTDQMGYISAYYSPDVNIYDYGMETGEMKYIEYSTLAHECSHAVMDAKGQMGKIGRIMTEGSADFYAESVLKALKISTLEDYHYYSYETPINEDTAEQLFCDDFDDLGHANRGAEYSFGFYFSEFLQETYGDNFLTEVTAALKQKNIADYESDEEKDRQARTETFKSVFGEDVFTRFGLWYTKNIK